MTSRSSAYFALVSRLKNSGLRYESLIPGSNWGTCQLVLTTREEALAFGDRALVLEDLDENPGIFRGQIMSRLDGGCETITVGVDPGKRTGLAVFYGESLLDFGTFNSFAGVCSRIAYFQTKVPCKGLVVRVGNGNKSAAERLLEDIGRATGASIEIVDESGTSARASKIRGARGDEGAAMMIAFRKGVRTEFRSPRSPGRTV